MTSDPAIPVRLIDTGADAGDDALAGAVIAVVALDEVPCERRAAHLRAAGATVRCAVAHVNALATLSVPGFDAVVLEVGDDPEGFVGLVRTLHEDPRTRALPILALPAPHIIAARLEALGGVRVAGVRDDAALAETLARLVEHRRAEVRAAEFSHALEERLRAAGEHLSALRREAQTVTHDARALCGIVVGFAANLRDGIDGAIDQAQRDHVVQILEAAKDTTALVDRFGAAIRVHTDVPSDGGSMAPPGQRRAHRRTLVDLVQLARATIELFEAAAETKGLRVTLEAPASLSLWCDAMQVKQIVTNLLVNAIKFTPAGGKITLEARLAAPASPGPGPGARQMAELVVRDTGPGVPAADRKRVFDRGARLDRDRDTSGSGIGLSVVREVVLGHGGTVHVEDTAEGGAAFVVRLPVDMRQRRESSGAPLVNGKGDR